MIDRHNGGCICKAHLAQKVANYVVTLGIVDLERWIAMLFQFEA